MKHKPSQPGLFLNETVIKPLGLGMSALSRVLNGKAGISPDLAVQLEPAGHSKARFWLNLQASYDLWQATQRQPPDVIKLDAVA